MAIVRAALFCIWLLHSGRVRVGKSPQPCMHGKWREESGPHTDPNGTPLAGRITRSGQDGRMRPRGERGLCGTQSWPRPRGLRSAPHGTWGPPPHAQGRGGSAHMTRKKPAITRRYGVSMGETAFGAAYGWERPKAVHARQRARGPAATMPAGGPPIPP